MHPHPAPSPHTRAAPAPSGFTLLELSIVLIVIGLIAGGFVVGQSIVNNANKRGFITETEKLKSSLQAFIAKYNGPPGDINTATTLWGTAAGGCPDGTRSGTATCDGNNDGNIGTSSSDTSEMFNFWQHLQNAGLIGGSYTGRTGSPDIAMPGSNIYTSQRYKAVGYAVRYFAPDHACVSTQTLNCQQGVNAFMVGRAASNCGWTGWYPWCAFLSPSDAYDIDKKADDGMPGRGMWRSFGSDFTPSCTTANTPTASYVATRNPTPRCAFLILNPW